MFDIVDATSKICSSNSGRCFDASLTFKSSDNTLLILFFNKAISVTPLFFIHIHICSHVSSSIVHLGYFVLGIPHTALFHNVSYVGSNLRKFLTRQVLIEASFLLVTFFDVVTSLLISLKLSFQLIKILAPFASIKQSLS
ncbi:hypothetical protein GLOIN_2v1612898 [Rhizophagus irregularis DAOM 181602=DAOM 197198]|uniref:Uncharacterized protein n=1 Tax=Rhizophagus irregularis (strain DAOM 181602 / DAOM 197198 / MUCL 43194) TaxID=747089 RepID=A0A2P4PZU4_RHIID|nr:hypothetical protein GLOIN_2v1612898 [Rhizophagus irregularis DAOM 181602=DAOM 197198]POG70888.1 hypothetical protein GLOIN_2v1612898 [Rhizophagus irregularis DAOM 181602=DAOM 197198]GET53575.1 hypothetical protein GLOIN_2v1612898 [Rhizophagus irregularis DAOM 181602=DAOM 197198]|eukprot:XP_025177754.1 hypothetical protein GLOIN_2v1612898 [Rhizophagus irregularis DAOM 181602=DAOM 197198]